MAICEVSNCDLYAAKHLCRKHLIAAKTGRIAVKDEWGIQLNPMCTEPGCPRRANSRKLPSLCGLHQEYRRNGIDPSTLRPKRRWVDPPKECSREGCVKPASARGMCTNHYQTATRNRRLSPCSVEGCDKQTSRGFCSKHNTLKHTDPPILTCCIVPNCENTFVTRKQKLCRTHQTDRYRKGLDIHTYVEIHSIVQCAVCGSSERMATDHDHSHHGSKDQMCIECIRGRLCNGCNTALGLLGESEERIMGLVTYLREHKPGYFKGRV